MFETVMLLAAPTAGFRLLGALGVRRFATWRDSAAHGLAVMLVFTASAHFAPAGVTAIPNREDMEAMIPPFVPFHAAVVYGSGALELLGAAGLVKTSTRRAAGLGLAAFFVGILPANIYAAVEHVTFDGEPATPLWFRIPEQALYVATALWAAQSVSRRHRNFSPSPVHGASLPSPSASRVADSGAH
uniref:DoxX family protein n=1 Tax=Streptomyces polyasparticus TaxID=2767826 RepID=UPI001F3E51BC|nr:hypothetical protein [Streptomyces polyasparticus]